MSALDKLVDSGNWLFKEDGEGLFDGDVNIPTAAAELAALREVAQVALKWRGQWPDEEDIREATEESCSCAICQLILACDALKGDS